MTFAVKNTQLFFLFFFLKLIIATLPYLAHPRISNTLPFELSIPLLPKNLSSSSSITLFPPITFRFRFPHPIIPSPLFRTTTIFNTKRLYKKH